MKKYALLLITGASMTMNAWSQLQFGFSGGANIASLLPLSNGFGTVNISSFIPPPSKYVQYSLNKSITCAYGGFVLRGKLNTYFNLRSGVDYTGKGVEFYVFNNALLTHDNIYDHHYTVNFIEIPIDLEYTAPVGGATAYIAGGPFIGYAVGGRISGYVREIPGGPPLLGTTDSFLNYSGSSKMNVPDSGRWDMGLNGKIGFQFRFGLFIQASYDYSLTKAKALSQFQEPEYTNVNPGNLHYSVFQIGIGYMFVKKRKKGKGDHV